MLGAVAVEIVWLLLIAVFAAGSVYPLYGIIAKEFIVVNIVLAMLLTFYFRLVVFFHQVASLKILAVQVILFIVNPILFIGVLNKIQNMLFLFDSHDLLYFIIPNTDVNVYRMNSAFHLFRKEFLLFAVGLMIVLVLTELRIALAFVKRVREMD